MEPTWTYGVTTVPDRVDGLLPRTLNSLKAAGFPTPRLFVDGECDPAIYSKYNLEVSFRGKPLRTYGNWVISMWELYIRNPICHRYVIFQDDLVTYKNLRKYLNSCELPHDKYWNLYSFPQNEKLAPEYYGWYKSNQLGKGALALVFSRDALTTLLSSATLVDRPKNATRGHKSVDGGIVTALKHTTPIIFEHVHNPGLVQHTGMESTMGNRKHQLSQTFKGEEFDAMELCSVTESKVP